MSRSTRKSSPAKLPDAFSDARLEDEILTAAATAKLLGLSIFTLLRKRQEPDGGDLPWVRLSERRIGYRRGDVRHYQLARRRGALPEHADANTDAA
jgi:hypothetical protein